MAITANNSNEEVAGGSGIPMFVGIAPMQVVAVNPTLKELNDLGIPAKVEPEYIGVNINSDTFNKITFWVKCIEPEFLTRFDVLVKPEHRVAKSGKPQWCNSVGQFAFADQKASEAYDWFKDTGVREAYIGEETLMRFIQAYANVANGDECAFETMGKIMAGDVTEVRQLVNALSENRVRLLLGVKDGKYQQVYTKHFGRLKPFRKDLFIKQLNDDYGSFNAEYNATLELEKYVPGLIAPDPEPAAETADSNW
tara:strand:+ start:30 stop:788 length:759 start_codon:yes stop_codon:yes gene_type:complete